jgi:hypothetical protein
MAANIFLAMRQTGGAAGAHIRPEQSGESFKYFKSKRQFIFNFQQKYNFFLLTFNFFMRLSWIFRGVFWVVFLKELPLRT